MGSTQPKHPGEYWGHVAPADGQPGMAMDWPVDCQPAMDAAVRHVERWFDEQGYSSNLWAAFFAGRSEQESYTQRVAYEAAFFWRVQQRLMGTAASAVLHA
ncbi:MAG: hypothetical protein CTR55_10370 [Pseudomonas sp.]|uniref:LasR-specific antiactivator QslA n=1 Tax=Pseudomonas sp. TaxID=306 RepID=UPI000CB99AC6|nr:LasR-specific antiactivator QslA [Pseudomonas sp.]PJI49735.1 MAG: hypothetical protein CTR55_10370 [Pseudomonas sp.]